MLWSRIYFFRVSFPHYIRLVCPRFLAPNVKSSNTKIYYVHNVRQKVNNVIFFGNGGRDCKEERSCKVLLPEFDSNVQDLHIPCTFWNLWSGLRRLLQRGQTFRSVWMNSRSTVFTYEKFNYLLGQWHYCEIYCWLEYKSYKLSPLSLYFTFPFFFLCSAWDYDVENPGEMHL